MSSYKVLEFPCVLPFSSVCIFKNYATIEYSNGDNEWWVDDKEYSYEEWLKVIPDSILYLWRCYCGNG